MRAQRECCRGRRRALRCRACGRPRSSSGHASPRAPAPRRGGAARPLLVRLARRATRRHTGGSCRVAGSARPRRRRRSAATWRRGVQAGRERLVRGQLRPSRRLPRPRRRTSLRRPTGAGTAWPRPRRAGRSSSRSSLSASAAASVPCVRPSRARRAICATGRRSEMRAAASSIPNGIPSSRVHVSATSSTFASVSAKPGSASAARAANSSTPPGRPRPGTRQSRSPRQRNGSRLVARIVTCGHRRSSSSASTAQASTTCSQVSRSSSPVRVDRCWASASADDRCAGTWIPTVVAASSATRAGSVSLPSSTNQVPPRKRSAAASAAAIARRVFPAPPAPVSVSIRSRRRSSPTSWSSRSRPRKLVSWTGSFLGVGSSAAELASSPR